MHSGSSISPKHPAIPVSIGIASLVLEGRSAALDDSSTIHVTPGSDGLGGSGGGDGSGGAGGSQNGAGAADDDGEGGFCGKKRASSSSSSSSSAAAGSLGEASGGTTSSSGACTTLQQCSLQAISEAQKMVACHMSDASQRINLKLQQIRSSCPGTSKDEVHQLVTVSGREASVGGGGGRRTSTRHPADDERMYGCVESFVNAASSGRGFGGAGAGTGTGGGSTTVMANAWSHEAGPGPSSGGGSSTVIYSGFEKMNVLGTVSPIKNHHPTIGNSFINFSSSSTSSGNSLSASSSSSAVHSRKPAANGGSSSKPQQQQQQQSRPREGPHCEQFLKKIGLNKPDAADGPEHSCTYRNKFCLRWQVYFKQLSSILTNGEAVCIEVYLGPENHTILLEQWILKLVMTKSPTTMTLQSLCAAIRSQLYFSQISAWSDLIKNSLEPELFNHPRIRKPLSSVPGVVSPLFAVGSVVVPGSKAIGASSFLPQPKLDILFRIRTYDSTACFNEKPLVHNFPDANVADGFVIQVCLKSLPRLDRIPGIHAALDAAKMGGSGCATATGMLLPGDRLDLPSCHEKGKHRCAFRELELDEDEEGEGDDPRMADGDDGTGVLLTSAAISHREKQLLKYKKRMMKREKKKKSAAEGSGGVAGFPLVANGGSNSNSSSSSSSSSSGSHSSSASIRNGSSMDSSAYASPMSYSSCSNGSGGGTSTSQSVLGPYGNGANGHTIYANGSHSASAAASTTTTTTVNPITASCSNGSCSNALTSTINSIQPPLYSSNHAHQQQHGSSNAMMVVCCDDRYHSITANSKSTQTSGALPFVASVATQTDGAAAASGSPPIVYCNDCRRRSGNDLMSEHSNGRSGGAETAIHNNGTTDREVARGGTSSSSSSSNSTNSDRRTQYFNDYYRSYDIINDNCDKRHTPPPSQPACFQRAAAVPRGVVDAPMETSTTCLAQVEHGPIGNGAPRRASFIVGGDGYEGDEDEGVEAAGRAAHRSSMMPNGAAPTAAPLQKGDLLLQAIQRTASMNGGSVVAAAGGTRQQQQQQQHGGGSFAGSNYHGVEESGRPAPPGSKHKAGLAMNNNNYATTNNNNVGESGRNGGKDDGGSFREPVGGDFEGGSSIGSGGGGTPVTVASSSAAKCERSECDTFSKEKLDLGDCRLCKRQKTKHNFKLNLTNLLSSAVSSALPLYKPAAAAAAAAVVGSREVMKKTIITTVVDCGSTPPGCRRTLSESLVGHLTIPGSSSGGSGGSGGTKAGMGASGSDEPDNCHVAGGSNGYDGLYQNGDSSPDDSAMLSSSTGAVGNGGVFTFEQMKSYRRAFSEDVIDTITSRGSNSANGRANIVPKSGAGMARDSTEEDEDTSEDNENDVVCRQRCGCAEHRRSDECSPLAVEGYRLLKGQIVHHRPQTSTPAASETGKCKEPLYISCSETDCSVSTASSVSPHKKQILSCAAIGGGNGTSSSCRGSEGGESGTRTCSGSPGGGTSNVRQMLQYKSSPKINLNYVFCLSPLARDDSGFTSGSSPATSTSFPATSPIAIDGVGAGSGSVMGCATVGSKAGRGQRGSGSLFRYDFEESPVSPVSGTIKSKSAPAFPFSPPPGALSPRFLRNVQQQRLHRTRYPSERSSVSERSSIGSDEQLSDDELSYLMDSSNGYSPLSSHQLALMGSPLKMGQPTRTGGLLASSQMLSKVLNRNLFRFGRAPLLGTLEESLLQRRLTPKFQVADFKVLLGASGSFCPTQLTIPVASYFYELPGQHLTTPYVCELRLPRKGYSIPRTGTVQATLLNPLGTVVRMFVVPYDFRDMPAMSTTFIRQRILACDESSLKLLGKNIEQLSNAEQMKLLRYAIHLRFQTSRSGKLSLHTDIRLLISRRTDCDTAAAHAKNLLESPNELKVVTIVPENPKFSLRIDKQ